MSSMQSLEGSEAGSRGVSRQRDSSVDRYCIRNISDIKFTMKLTIFPFSRLSGGSTKSEMLERDRKYGKGIIRKLTHKLTKSSSVDDPNMTDYSLQVKNLNIPKYFFCNMTSSLI